MDTLVKLADRWVTDFQVITMTGGSQTTLLPGDAERWSVAFCRPSGDTSLTVNVSPKPITDNNSGIMVGSSLVEIKQRDFGTLATGPWYAFANGNATLIVLWSRWKG